MIGSIQRNEAFRVSGRLENFGGIFNADDAVHWRMKDEQGFVQVLNGFLHVNQFEIVEKLLFDPEGLAGQGDFCFSCHRRSPSCCGLR